MSLKSKTGRLLASPQNLRVPEQFQRDFNVSRFFNDMLSYLFQSYKIIVDDIPFGLLGENITTSGSIRLLGDGVYTITLNDDPQEDETVELKTITADIVTLDGNGKTIDGAATLATTGTAYEYVKIVYSTVADEWLITS